jgi:RHS repeat-associated protein
VSSNVNGASVSYAYNQNNRLASVTDNRTGGTTNHAYDQTNQLSSMAYPNGVTQVYSYDTRDRTTALNVNGPGGVLASYTQTFSLSGRKTSILENTGRTENDNYDSIYRLLTENIASDPVSVNNGLLTYALDAVGNRTSLSSTLAALQAQTFTYDNDDRSSADTFDGNGNTLTSGGVTYTYDFQDWLVSTSTGVQITYDGDGNRVSETVAGITTKFLVDTQTPTGYAQIAEELVSGTVSAQYTYGTMRISQKRGATVSYYGYDAGGSVRQLLNASGVLTDTYAYDAFGNTVVRTGTTVNPFQYRGEQFDSDLQLYYLRARYYRPTTGTFLTADASEGEDELPVTQNRYLYGNADPVQYDDPSGHGGRMISTALREITLQVGRQFASLASRQAVRLIGCAFALAILGECGALLFEHMIPWRALPGGGGINISVGVGIKEVGGWVEDTKTVIGVYSSSPLPEEVIQDFKALENEVTEVVFSTSMHAERLVQATIQSGGRLVGALTTAWNMCSADKQNCKAVFGTLGGAVGGAVVRGIGRCIYELFPIVP